MGGGGGGGHRKIVLPEPGAHPEECLLDPCCLARGSEPEKGMVLHCALPEVLTTLLRA